MDALHLPPPKRIDEAVPANLHLGLRHDAPAPHALVQRQGYAGDISVTLAHQWWQAGTGVLVDVHTDAERAWVGFVPDAVPLAWKQWPAWRGPRLTQACLRPCQKDKKALLLCRSGVRSIAAAKRATELGMEAYNICGGDSRVTPTTAPSAASAAAGV